MFDVAWPEIIVIGAVALVAIGPKDMPKILRVLGSWTGKARRAFLSIQHDVERLGYEAEEAERRKRRRAGSATAPSPPDEPQDTAKRE